MASADLITIAQQINKLLASNTLADSIKTDIRDWVDNNVNTPISNGNTVNSNDVATFFHDLAGTNYSNIGSDLSDEDFSLMLGIVDDIANVIYDKEIESTLDIN